MRVLVCGDRTWNKASAIHRELAKLSSITCIIEGGAPGADSIAYSWASEMVVECETYRADWIRFGKAAGPLRNQRMLTEGKPDLVLAFHPNIDRSKGTRHMVEIARRAGVECRVFKE